jgi:hypothetical protein
LPVKIDHGGSMHRLDHWLLCGSLRNQEFVVAIVTRERKSDTVFQNLGPDDGSS